MKIYTKQAHQFKWVDTFPDDYAMEFIPEEDIPENFKKEDWIPLEIDDLESFKEQNAAKMTAFQKEMQIKERKILDGEKSCQ